MMPMMTMKRVWLLIAAVVTLSLQVGAFAPPVVHVATTSKSTEPSVRVKSVVNPQ